MKIVPLFLTTKTLLRFQPCQYGVHYLSCLIEEKTEKNNKLGQFGSHAIQIFLLPANIIDMAIRIIAAPIFCIIAHIYEAVKDTKHIQDLFFSPLSITLCTGCFIFLTFVKSLRPLLAAMNGVMYGAQAGKYYFYLRNDRTIYLTIGSVKAIKDAQTTDYKLGEVCLQPFFDFLPESRFAENTFGNPTSFNNYCLGPH